MRLRTEHLQEDVNIPVKNVDNSGTEKQANRRNKWNKLRAASRKKDIKLNNSETSANESNIESNLDELPVSKEGHLTILSRWEQLVTHG